MAKVTRKCFRAFRWRGITDTLEGGASSLKCGMSRTFCFSVSGWRATARASFDGTDFTLMMRPVTMVPVNMNTALCGHHLRGRTRILGTFYFIITDEFYEERSCPYKRGIVVLRFFRPLEKLYCPNTLLCPRARLYK